MGVYIYYARLFIESQSRDVSYFEQSSINAEEEEEEEEEEQKNEMNETFSSFYHPLLLYM